MDVQQHAGSPDVPRRRGLSGASRSTSARRLRGWSMPGRIRTELVLDALALAGVDGDKTSVGTTPRSGDRSYTTED